MKNLTKHTDLLAAGGVVLIVMMLIVPLPAALLDIFIALNIAARRSVCLVSFFIMRIRRRRGWRW